MKRLIKAADSPYRSKKYVTQVTFDFGHDGEYDEKFIEEGIEELLAKNPNLEFTGYVDFTAIEK